MYGLSELETEKLNSFFASLSVVDQEAKVESDESGRARLWLAYQPGSVIFKRSASSPAKNMPERKKAR